MRIGIGGVFQETNTFVTAWSGFAGDDHFEVLVGEEILTALAGTATEVGGALEAAEDLGVTVVPLLLAIASPGPVVARDTYERLAEDLLHRLADAGPLDAVVLVQHGAGVTEGLDSLDLDLLERVRGVVGAGVRLVATFDLHATLPVRAADVLDLALPYHHYPHTDMAERGEEAVRAAVRLVTDGAPQRAMVRVPLLVTAGGTGAGMPMAEVLARCQELEALPGVIDVSVMHGFPFADVPEAGAHVSVAVEHSRDDAADLAQQVAALLWERRDLLVGRAVGAEAAVAEARTLLAGAGSGPVVINESADNPGGGAPGDGTHLLRALLAVPERSLLAALTCPRTAAAAAAAGVGADIDVELGGWSAPVQGGPVRARARVRTLTDGEWVGTTAMGRGARYRMGRSALLQIGPVDVVVVTRPTQVWDPAVITRHGTDPRDYALVAVKSSQHFRAGFATMARGIVTADPPGFTGLDLDALPRARAHDLHPLTASVGER